MIAPDGRPYSRVFEEHYRSARRAPATKDEAERAIVLAAPPASAVAMDNAAEIEAVRTVKSAFDPAELLNPGVLFPP
jgi:FAD/FMN-containing dehydrogenase